jgi:hypothetical protein
VSLLDTLRRRFAKPPEQVAAAVSASGEGDERVLAWGALSGGGWLVATSRGLRTVGAEDRWSADELLRWHEIAHARWTAAGQGGGSFAVTALTEVEPGVQARQEPRKYVLTDPDDLPAVVRRRVDESVLDSQRVPLPNGGGVLLVARRIPGQAAREWSVVFDHDADRADPAARELARQKLADLVAADAPF